MAITILNRFVYRLAQIFSADRSVPFWHMINGPVADAIYHVGQIVSYRRTTGNPMYGGVSVFSGRTSTLDK